MSFFHRVKKAVNQISDTGVQTKDAAFEEANKNFEQYAADVLRINQSVSSLLASLKSFTVATTSTVDSLAQVFNAAKSDDPNDRAFVELSKNLERQQRDFNKTHSPNLVQQLSNTAVYRLTELMEQVNTLKKRIAERNSVVEELDYYTSKVAKLVKQAAGKPLNEKDRAKKERNEQKLADLRKRYEVLNSDLVADLDRVWVNRLQSLGLVQRDISRVQQGFAQQLAAAADPGALDLPEQISLAVGGSGVGVGSAADAALVAAIASAGSATNPRSEFRRGVL